MTTLLQTELVQVVKELRAEIAAYRSTTAFENIHPRLPAAEIVICISELYLKDEMYLPLSTIEVWFQHGRNVEDAFQGTQFQKGIKLYYRMVELCKKMYLNSKS